MGKLSEPVFHPFLELVESGWRLWRMGRISGARIQARPEWRHECNQLHFTPEKVLPKQPGFFTEVWPQQLKLQPQAVDGG